MTGTCTRCARTGRLRRADLCSACYQQLWRAGRLPEQPAKPRTYSDPAPCHHKHANHRHGTRTCYVLDKCRCQDCSQAAVEIERERRQRRAISRWNPELHRFVDGDQVRAHLRNLMDAGMGWKNIAAAAGIACSTVYPILYGKHLRNPDHPEHRPPRKQVRRDIADKLLAVRLDLAAGAVIDGTGTRRRLQALVATGWSQARLAARLGMGSGNFGNLIHGHLHTGVTKDTAERVRALYDELWNTAPPVTNRWEQGSVQVAQRTALMHGWALPLCWDDDEIDDPAARPHGTDQFAVTAARVAELRRLVAAGATRRHILHRLGIQNNQVVELITRHAPDLLPAWRAIPREPYRKRRAAA